MSSSETQTYSERKAEIKERQSTMTREQIFEHMAHKNESAVDLNNLPAQSHNFVNRGVVVTCEGAGHPSHRFYKRT
jgi:hypothetical protein